MRLRVKDVDGSRGELRVHDTKGGKPRFATHSLGKLIQFWKEPT
jgi:hypothetical protein